MDLQQSVKIIIKDPNENIIFQTNVNTTENGEFYLLWKVTQEYAPGTYSLVAEDSFGKLRRGLHG